MKRALAGLLFIYTAASGSASAAESAALGTPPNFPLPEFKSAVFNVREFGATGNGTTNDTAAINQAIDKCNSSGGGDVVFPAGMYAAASIHLKSNVRFVLDRGAIITGAKSGYDPPEPNEFDKYQDFGHSHFHNALMWGENIDNFAIIGGRIDGGNIIEGDPEGPDMGDKVISIKSSRNLHFQDITHQTGGHFVYLLNDCENVTINNVTIKKSRDAVNLVSCRNVQVHDCNFTGCGDDTLALKSDYALGRKIGSKNIYAWNCYFETACNALQIGSETAGDFQNINFWNIRIGRAWKAGIGITSADGSVIDGVNYRDITIKDAACPIFLRVTDRLRSGDPKRKIGAIKNVKISRVTVTDGKRGEGGWPRTCLIAGRPESRLENIVLENVRISYRGDGKKEPAEMASNRPEHRNEKLGPLPAAGFYIHHVSGLTFKDVEPGFEVADSRPTLVAFDVDGFNLVGFKTKQSAGIHTLQLEKIDNFSVGNSPGLKDRTAEKVEAILQE